jgi:hypothetical protein
LQGERQITRQNSLAFPGLGKRFDGNPGIFSDATRFAARMGSFSSVLRSILRPSNSFMDTVLQGPLIDELVDKHTWFF